MGGAKGLISEVVVGERFPISKQFRRPLRWADGCRFEGHVFAFLPTSLLLLRSGVHAKAANFYDEGRESPRAQHSPGMAGARLLKLKNEAGPVAAKVEARDAIRGLRRAFAAFA